MERVGLGIQPGGESLPGIVHGRICGFQVWEGGGELGNQGHGAVEVEK